MSAKRVDIPVKPARVTPEADTWVESRNTASADEQQASRPAQVKAVEKEEIKRLTIDIPASLHRDIKAQCAMRGTKIADEVRELLLKKYRSS